MWTDIDLDGLKLRLSAQPEDRDTRTIQTAAVHYVATGEWIANLFRLTQGRNGICLRVNHRREDELTPRRSRLVTSVIDFQAAIRAGKVNACIE